jgi:hypothetical protein
MFELVGELEIWNKTGDPIPLEYVLGWYETFEECNAANPESITWQEGEEFHTYAIRKNRAYDEAKRAFTIEVLKVAPEAVIYTNRIKCRRYSARVS